MKKKIKIGIVEDHQVVRQGLVLLFNDEPNIKVQFDVGNGADALNAMKTKKVDILLLDIEMPIMDGRQTLKKLSERVDNVSAIMFSAYYEIAVISECISLGAKGFLAKHCDFDKLVDAILAVDEKGFYFDDVVSKALVGDVLNRKQEIVKQPSNQLSLREIEIIVLICSGLKTKEIAEKLFISLRTVEGHRKKISEKTNTLYPVELVIYAIKYGIYELK
jgi:two-component system response regulator DegU